LAAGLRRLEKQTLADLLRTLRDDGMTVVFVEHDMEIVGRFANVLPARISPEQSPACARISLVRAVVFSGTFVEGWATYAEQLMADAGYGGPEVRMQQLKMRLRMILNAIIDQNPNTPMLLKATAQGNRKATSRSKMMNRMATR